MIDPEKLPTHILEALRQKLGLHSDDTSGDDRIARMNVDDAWRAYCQWYGIFARAVALTRTIDAIREASDEVSPEVAALRARVAELEAMIDAICRADTTEAQETAIERITALRAKW